MSVRMKILTKDFAVENSKSIEQLFNEWSDANPDVTIQSTQFFQFNKLNADNSIEKQYMCCGVTYFPATGSDTGSA